MLILIDFASPSSITFTFSFLHFLSFLPFFSFFSRLFEQKQDRKKKIRQFSGFQDDEIAKKTKFLAGQKTLAPLKKLAGLLDVQVVGPKNASGYRAALIEFGCKPTESGKGPAKKAAAAKRPAKAAKKGKAPAGKGKKRAPARKKKKKISAAALASVKAARGSRYLYAQSVKAEVKEENPDASKPELLKLIKEQYDALSDTDRTKFQRLAAKDVKRFNDAVAEFDQESEDEDVSESEEEDDDDDSEYEEDDDEEPPNKKKKIEPEESSDEEPHETGTFPTDKQIKKRIRRIVRSADLTVMTKKTVRADAAKFFGVNLDEKKNLIKEVITVTVDAIE